MEPDAEAGMAADWERFSHWLHCVCIVTFDLELGQAIEAIYPPHIKLTEKEKTSTCYLAFPDSNSGCHGDTQFTFRFRQSPSRRAIADVIYDVDMPVLLQRDPYYFYGYVYFRQVKDNSLKRGYFQKSLVLLSRLPFVNLFSSVAKLVAPEYFEKLEPCLEAACKDIDRWPNPIPGKTLNLPIMGLVIQVRIPSRSDKFSACTLKQDICENMLPAPLVLSSVHEGDMFRALQPVLPHLQLLWELVLLGEPLVVMATSPAATADTVLALVSSISPLRYSSDFRPYFTIHDSEFREITSQKQAPPSVILGVTNPFFVKTLQQWPHIVRVGDLRGPADASKQTKIKKVNKLRSLDAKPGVYTSHKTYLTKDRAIIKRLQKGAQRKRPSEVQNAILRRYLMELTHSFIIPLERYVASLMPLQKSITPWKSPPQVGPFVPEEFFKSLEHAGPQLTSVLKGDWVGLYRQFLRSPNFDTWFRARHSEMTQKLELLQLEALLRADLKLWLEHKSEVEVVDMVIKLQDKMETAQQAGIAVRPDMFERLQALVDTAVQGLPADLQHVLQRT